MIGYHDALRSIEEIFRCLAYPKLTSAVLEYEMLVNLYQMFSDLIDTQDNQPISKSEQYLAQAVGYIKHI